MSEILICTMGLSPGVITRMTQYLQHEEKRALSEVWVVRTSNQQIGMFYNEIICSEFREGNIITNLKLNEKVVSPEDTKEPRDIQTFADEFFEFMYSKVLDYGPIVHLCLSGGRKSMTYAATMGFVKLVTKLTPEVVRNKLALWHIQLDEEVLRDELEVLRRNYENRKVSEINAVQRKKLLYPDEAIPILVPFLYLGELDSGKSDGLDAGGNSLELLWTAGVPDERR